jgi:hypothetical protein
MKNIIVEILEFLKGIKDILGGIVNGDIIQKLKGIEEVFMGWGRTILSPFQAILDTIGVIIEKVSGIKYDLNPINFLEKHLPIPLADGGIITSPTNAIVGEAGPEAVIPLSRMSEISSRNKATSSDDALIRKIDELISVVKQGGHVYLDSNKVGTAMAVGAVRVQ